MTTRIRTCSAPTADRQGTCGGAIRPSYMATEVLQTAQAPKEVTRPAACEQCGTTYEDVVSIAMTHADLDLVGQRLSPSTRQTLEAAATELTAGSYEVALTEDRARDLASKAANLGLVEIARRVRQELTGLTMERRKG